MKRLKAHIDMVDKPMDENFISDWNGDTPNFLIFENENNSPVVIGYTDINYDTGDITLFNMENKVLKSKVIYELEEYEQRFNGYIDYQMYNDGKPCNEDTLELKVQEVYWDERPWQAFKKQKEYMLPYKDGAEITTEILNWNIKILKLSNEEITVSVNGEEYIVKLYLDKKISESDVVYMGRYDETMYEFGKKVILSLRVKN